MSYQEEPGEKQRQPLFTTMYQSSTFVVGLPRDYMLLMVSVSSVMFMFGDIISTAITVVVLYILGWILKRWDDEFVTILFVKIKDCGGTKTKYNNGNFYGS